MSNVKVFEIRTFWDLKNTWDDISKNLNGDYNKKLTSFIDAIDPLKDCNKRSEEWFKCLFHNIVKNGIYFYNEDNT